MKIKMLGFVGFILISGHIYSQEAGGGSSKSSGSSSSAGSNRREIKQNFHFKQSKVTNTKGNGTSFRRKGYRRIMRNEDAGFAARGTFFKKKEENDGFSANRYRYKPNRKKGIR